MKQHPIRKFLHKFGVDLHKYRPVPDKLNWLRDMHIETVLDVGANIGQFASEIREILPNAHIYSFEPIASCYSQLIENMKNDKKFTAINVGLGDKNEKVSINKSAYSPSSSILTMEAGAKTLFPHTVAHETETITVKRLDDIRELSPDNLKKEILLKIDTEGYEGKALAGARKILRVAKVVIIENSYVSRYQGQMLFSDIYSLLRTEGFFYRGAWQQKLNSKTGEIIFEDSIFLR